MDNSNPSNPLPQSTLCPCCQRRRLPRIKGKPPWPVCYECSQLVYPNQRSGWLRAWGKYNWKPGDYGYKRNYELTTQYLIDNCKEKLNAPDINA